MSLDSLKHIPDGAKIYLCPVGLIYGAALPFLKGPSGQHFMGARIMARENGEMCTDITVSAADLLKNIAQVPDDVSAQLQQYIAALAEDRLPIALDGLSRPLAFTRPLIMGVLNVTPDSFSDGGKYLDPTCAVTQARRMIAEGADIIDVGGESTRPGADPVWEGDEAERVVPVIAALQSENIPISIDTRHSFVMGKATEAGAHIINDVSALTYDPESLTVAKKSGVPVILMHSQGQPKTMQDNPTYQNTLLDVYDYLEARIKVCVEAGISHNKLIIDPGIGFGKRMVQDNLALINGLSLLHTLGVPILFGASRKSFIGAVTGEENASDRLSGSLAAAMKAVEYGAQIVRVHDVAETRQALAMTQAFADAAIMDNTPFSD